MTTIRQVTSPDAPLLVGLCELLIDSVDRASADPGRYYLPAYIGSRGWFGMRLDRGTINWREVENIVELSYGLAAPKTLAALVESRDAKGKAPSSRRAARG